MTTTYVHNKGGQKDFLKILYLVGWPSVKMYFCKVRFAKTS